MTIEITVGPQQADLTGSNHLALQAAVDYVSALGGGTVRLLPGTYDMRNSLFLRPNLRLVGSGEDTILRKNRCEVTRLIEDLDWYGTAVPVADPGIFEVGGALLLRGVSPHNQAPQIIKNTVVAIEGNRVHLSRDTRHNFWIDTDAEAATLFPVIRGDNVNDILIENLTIDGNRAENENLDGNHGGCVYLQDCDRVTVRDCTLRDYNGDGVSWQVCDDVTVDGCRSLNNADLGLHPGSGSQRPVITGNTIRGCDVGLFWCWGVKHGLASGNLIEDSGKYGTSIGHRDTDNVLRDNIIRRSGVSGVLFREHPHPGRDPHRNLLERNLIEDSGLKGDCVAIEMLGASEDVVLRDNRLVDTRRKAKSRQRIGLRVGKGITGLALSGNTFEGLEADVVDQREKLV